jgi:hypothetical protein
MTATDRRADGSERLDVDDESMWSQARRPALSTEALHRIAARVKAQHPSGVGARARWRVWAAASALLLIGGVAGAGVATFVMTRPTRATADRVGENSPVARARAAGSRAGATEPATEPAPNPSRELPPPIAPAAVVADTPPLAPTERSIPARRNTSVQLALRAVAPPPPTVAPPPPVESSPSGPAAEAAA